MILETVICSVVSHQEAKPSMMIDFACYYICSFREELDERIYRCLSFECEQLINPNEGTLGSVDTLNKSTLKGIMRYPVGVG